MESKRFFDLDKCKGSRLPFPFWSSSPWAEILYKCSAKGASRVHKFQNGEACPHAVQEPPLDTLATEEDLICLRFGNQGVQWNQVPVLPCEPAGLPV